MRYLPRVKGAKLGLYDEHGFAPSLPNGIKVRFDTIGVPASFQFFDGKKPISPIMIQLEDEDKQFRFIATLKSGLKESIDLGKQFISKPYLEKLENIYISEEGEVLFDPMSGKAEPYVLDKKGFKTPFENGYLLSTLVGVKNASGKCAILDAYSKVLVTDFVLNAGNYGLVGALNLDTSSMLKSYYIVQTVPEEKETTDTTAKKFIIAGEDGQFVAELISHKYLWNQKTAEKQPDGTEKEFSYVAFAERDNEAKIKTRVLKIDIESGKVEHEYQLPYIAIMSIKPDKSFIFTTDGRLVLVTANPEKQASMGAYVLNADGSVETLLNNVNAEIEYTGHYKKGRFLTYKNAESVGKIALDEKARTFEVNKAEFVSLARKYFGASSSSELRPKLQRIEEQVASSGKKKPTGGGPNGGEGPNGSGFGG